MKQRQKTKVSQNNSTGRNEEKKRKTQEQNQ